MKRRLLVAVACVAFAGAVCVPVAIADPINAKNSSQINASCSGHSVMVVVNGNGTFTPAHVLGSTSVFIPTALDLTFTFTPTGGSPEPPMTNMAAKAGPVKGNIVSCDIPLQTLFSGPQGTATIQGTVTGFFTPR
jgi:hypothetical protein